MLPYSVCESTAELFYAIMDHMPLHLVQHLVLSHVGFLDFHPASYRYWGTSYEEGDATVYGWPYLLSFLHAFVGLTNLELRAPDEATLWFLNCTIKLESAKKDDGRLVLPTMALQNLRLFDLQPHHLHWFIKSRSDLARRAHNVHVPHLKALHINNYSKQEHLLDLPRVDTITEKLRLYD